MTALGRFLGNEGVKQPLVAALQAGTLPHAVLLSAPDGCGRGYFARCLAADYLYPAGGPGADAVLRGESPEVLTLSGRGKSGQIPIDDVRAVRRDMFRTATGAAGRVVLVRDAHRMGIPAANALLKVLEEPPGGVLFLLTTFAPSAVPVTVQSRCTVYTLSPPPAAACEQQLRGALPEGQPDIMPALLTTVYGARLGLCRKVLLDEARLAVLRNAFLLVKAYARGDQYAMLRVFTQYEGSDDGMRDARDSLLSDFTCLLELSMRDVEVQGLPLLPQRLAAGGIPPVTAAREALFANANPKITFAALTVAAARSR